MKNFVYFHLASPREKKNIFSRKTKSTTITKPKKKEKQKPPKKANAKETPSKPTKKEKKKGSKQKKALFPAQLADTITFQKTKK